MRHSTALLTLAALLIVTRCAGRRRPRSRQVAQAAGLEARQRQARPFARREGEVRRPAHLRAARHPHGRRVLDVLLRLAALRRCGHLQGRGQGSRSSRRSPTSGCSSSAWRRARTASTSRATRTSPVFSFGDDIHSVVTAAILKNPDGSVHREDGKLRMYFAAVDFPERHVQARPLRDDQRRRHQVGEADARDGERLRPVRHQGRRQVPHVVHLHRQAPLAHELRRERRRHEVDDPREAVHRHGPEMGGEGPGLSDGRSRPTAST